MTKCLYYYCTVIYNKTDEASFHYTLMKHCQSNIYKLRAAELNINLTDGQGLSFGLYDQTFSRSNILNKAQRQQHVLVWWRDVTWEMFTSLKMWETM